MSVNKGNYCGSVASTSAIGEVEDPALVEIDEDEKEDLIVRSKRYKQAPKGAKVHNATM